MKRIITLFVFTISIPLLAQINKEPNLDSNKIDKNLQVKDTLKVDSLVVNKEKKTYFKAQMSYSSNYTYYGRTNATAVPYATPLLGYFNKSGFFITTSLYYSLINQSKVEAVLFDIGYNYEVTDKLTLGAFANKTNYNNSSSIVSSSIKGYIGGYIEYDFNYFDLSLESEALLSKKTDINFTPTIDKEFELLKNKALKITPTFLANFSSLNYFEEFSNRKNKKNPGSQNYTTVETTVNDKKFTLLDYEFSIPVEYKLKNFVFFATPLVAFPVNPVYTTNVLTLHAANGTQIGNPVTIDSTQASELNLKNKFFFEIGFYYKF